MLTLRTSDCVGIEPPAAQQRLEELSFKIVKMLGAHDEVIERSSNFIIARAAYDTAVALWNGDDIELRQGTRVLNKSKPESA